MSQQKPSRTFPTPSSPEHHASKRPVSERKIQANRRNALRSTGPKTERGKRAVSRNAITHGLLAREVVITAGDGEESLEEFHALVESLCEHYEPVGVVEGMLVEKIAVCWWKLRRAVRAENGEIRKRLDMVSTDMAQRNSDKINLSIALSEMTLGIYSAENRSDQRVSTKDRQAAFQAAQSNLREHRSGLEYLNTLLEIAKSQMASDGHISKRIRQKIFCAFYLSDYFFAVTCLSAGPAEREAEDQVPKRCTENLNENGRFDIVALIDFKLMKLGLFKESALERENLALDAEARSFSLPPVDAADKILRHESHWERQFYRAMDQLERLQRQCRGENVPPPLNINLGKRS